MNDNVKTLDWLCEQDNPPVRYLTMKNLLETPESRIKIERKSLNDYPVIRGILKYHRKFWGEDEHLYRKYKGGYWNLIFLGDLFADGSDPIIRNGCQTILSRYSWQEKVESGNSDIICLASNLTRALANLGYGDDPRVLHLTENIATAIVNNDGIVCYVMDYSFLPQCYMALPKVLMALGSYTGGKPIVKKAIQVASERLLERNIYRYVPESQEKWGENYDRLSARLKKIDSGAKAKRTLKEELATIRPKMLRQNKSFKPKAGWLKFGYPLHYNSDILESMRSMADAGVDYDRRMDDALDIIEKSRLPDGRWKMGFSLNGKTWVDIEKRGKPSKWITYHALRVLKTYGRI